MRSSKDETEFKFDQLDDEALEQKKKKDNAVNYSSTTVFYSSTGTHKSSRDTDNDMGSDLTDATSNGADVASDASSGISDGLIDGSNVASDASSGISDGLSDAADAVSEASSGIGELILEGLLAVILFPFKLIGLLISSIFD